MPEDSEGHHSSDLILGLHFLGCNRFILVIYFFSVGQFYSARTAAKGEQKSATAEQLGYMDLCCPEVVLLHRKSAGFFVSYIIPERTHGRPAAPARGSVAQQSRPGVPGGVPLANFTPPRPKLRPTSPGYPPNHPVAPGPLQGHFPPAPPDHHPPGPPGPAMPPPALPIPPPNFGPGNWMPCFLWVPAFPMPGLQPAPAGPPAVPKKPKAEVPKEEEMEAIGLLKIVAIINVRKFGQKHMLKACSSLILF